MDAYDHDRAAAELCHPVYPPGRSGSLKICVLLSLPLGVIMSPRLVHAASDAPRRLLCLVVAASAVRTVQERIANGLLLATAIEPFPFSEVGQSFVISEASSVVSAFGLQ